MKIIDEKEEKRVWARYRLEDLGNKIQLAAPITELKVANNILKHVTVCMEWLKQNPNASEKDVNANHDKLLSEAQTTLSEEINSEESTRSNHVFEKSKMTAKYCIDTGMAHMKAKS